MEGAIDNIKNLLNKISVICVKANTEKEDRKKRGEEFNIFTTLGLYANEVRLHSALLAELLNPKGSHGMGDIMIKAFLKEIGVNPNFLDSTKINPYIKERHIGHITDTTGGRIDIILEDGHHAIIIENKIFAGDQENQLVRYNNYGKKFKSNNYVLLYLTLNGHKASEYSTSNLKLDYKCISYESDILKWLDSCVKLAYNKPLLRETLIQYINLLKQLTGKNMDNQTKSEMLSIMLEKENIDPVFSIIDLQRDFFKEIRTKFINNLVYYAAEEYKLSARIDPNLIDYWGNNQYLHLYKTKESRFEIRIGYIKATQAAGVFYGLFDKSKQQPFTKNGYEDILNKEGENEDYPFGCAYFRGPNRNWWDWNNIQTIKDMHNGSYLNYIKEFLSDLKDKRLFELLQM